MNSDAAVISILLVCLALVIAAFALGYAAGRSLCGRPQKSGGGIYPSKIV